MTRFNSQKVWTVELIRQTPEWAAAYQSLFQKYLGTKVKELKVIALKQYGCAPARTRDENIRRMAEIDAMLIITRQ